MRECFAVRGAIMEEREQTIDLMDLLKVLQKNLFTIAIVTVLTAAIGFVLAKFVVPKQYTSQSLMYVENSTSKSEESAINVNDINAAQKLVNTCQILFTSDQTLGELNEAFGGAYSVAKLKSMVSVASVNNTEVMRISVVSGSPEESYQINLKLSEISKKEFNRVIKNGSIETVSEASYPNRHTYPSTLKFTAIGLMIGLVGSYFVFLVIEMLDTKVKPTDDLMEMYDIPVFAEILDFKVLNGTRYAEGSTAYKKAYKSYDSYGYK